MSGKRPKTKAGNTEPGLLVQPRGKGPLIQQSGCRYCGSALKHGFLFCQTHGMMIPQKLAADLCAAHQLVFDDQHGQLKLTENSTLRAGIERLLETAIGEIEALYFRRRMMGREQVGCSEEPRGVR
jgi:hypothetical protein